MKSKKILWCTAVFFAAVFAFPAPLALGEARTPPWAGALNPELPPLPAFQPQVLENAENLSFVSEEVTLTASELSGVLSAVQIKSVSRLKNAGKTATAKIGVPFCGRAKSPPKIAVKTDGKETAGRIVYGGLYIRELGEFPTIDCAEPRAEGSGSLYVFDTAAGEPFTYTVKTESDKPLFHDGCKSYRTAEDSFSADANVVGEEYELFVGGDSEIVASDAAYVRQELTYDEYFERSYARLLRGLAESGDADALSAPKEYHYMRFADATKRKYKWDIADFYLSGEEVEIGMMYLFEWTLAGAEGVLEIEREGEATANTRFEPRTWNCEYRSAVPSPRFSFTVLPPKDCPYLLENALPFYKTENGYACFPEAAPETVALALCAAEHPRDLLQKKKTPDTRKILSLVFAGVLFCLGAAFLFLGLRKDRKR